MTEIELKEDINALMKANDRLIREKKRIEHTNYNLREENERLKEIIKNGIDISNHPEYQRIMGIYFSR